MAKGFEPPAGRQVFARTFQPLSADIDENGHVNNIVYLRWAQDLATAHWRAIAPVEEQAAAGWIALRHEVDYRHGLTMGETAMGRTWVAEAPEGPRFARHVRIDTAEGALCAQIRTVWCLIDAQTRRPRRVPDWMTALFT